MSYRIAKEHIGGLLAILACIATVQIAYSQTSQPPTDEERRSMIEEELASLNETLTRLKEDSARVVKELERRQRESRRERQEGPRIIPWPGHPLVIVPTPSMAARIARLQVDHYEIHRKDGHGVPDWIPKENRGIYTYVTPEELIQHYHGIRSFARYIILHGTEHRHGAVVFLTPDPAFAEVQQLRDGPNSDIYTLLDFNRKLANPSLKIKPIGEVSAAGFEKVEGKHRLVLWRTKFETGERTRSLVPPGRHSGRPFAPPLGALEEQ